MCLPKPYLVMPFDKSELCSIYSENGQLPPRSGIRSSEKTDCLSCVMRVRQHVLQPERVDHDVIMCVVSAKRQRGEQ